MKAYRNPEQRLFDFYHENRSELFALATNGKDNNLNELWIEYEKLLAKANKWRVSRDKKWSLQDHEAERLKQGFSKPKTNHERPIRIHEKGMFGQRIFYLLQAEGFIRQKNLKPFDEKLKNWLIWGHFER